MTPQQAFEAAAAKINASMASKADKKAMRRAAWGVTRKVSDSLAWLACPEGQTLDRICTAATGNEWFAYHLFD